MAHVKVILIRLNLAQPVDRSVRMSGILEQITSHSQRMRI